MGNGLGRSGFRALAFGLLVGAPATAYAHAVLVSPAPRDVGAPNADAHKMGPCGGVTRTNKPMIVEAGVPIAVSWKETVNHLGCFQVAYSPANDQNWVTLAQISDPNQTLPAGGRSWSTTVTIPPSCGQGCTLVLRQLMLGAPCGPDAGSVAAGDTYFSCADICTGANCDGGGGGADGGSSSSSSSSSTGGPTTTPTDGGGKVVGEDEEGPIGSRPKLSNDDGGCSVAFGATSGAGLLVAAGLVAATVARRRRPGKR